jgi:hypothetical protein
MRFASEGGQVDTTDFHFGSSCFESASYTISPSLCYFSCIKKCSVNSSCIAVTDFRFSYFWWPIFVVFMHDGEHFAPDLRTLHCHSTIQVCVSAVMVFVCREL